MRLTVKGQVTVPIDIRKYLGVDPRDEVDFVIDDGRVFLVRGGKSGDDLSKQLEKMRGSGNRRMSADEIMRLTRGE
jgi:bifunctional DNA-binding transcriptional regulator/antitoxin component of YhaV-PrlF toxin-antitoxin module